MTDEDTNDRMERANRIREMREGRRRTPADDDGDEAASDATTDGGETETESAADEPDASDAREPAAEETPSEDDEGDTDRGTEANDRNGVDGAGEDSAVETSGFEFDEPAGDDDGEERGNGATADEAIEPDEERERATPKSGVAESVSSSDATEAVDAISESGTFAIPDQATTVSEDDDQSMLDAEGSVAAARAAAGRRATHAGDRTRVLEFELGDERFCLDIEYIEEIVELENMTRVPNSPSYVEGVVDLRGQVTAIINPKDALAVDDDSRGDLIVVFDSEEMDEQGHLGWVVDEVRQVTPVTDEEVNKSPDEDDEHINGIINREDEDEFIVWTTPDLALNSTS